MRTLAAAAALICLLAASRVHGSGQLHTDGRFFRDASGAAVILRGVDTAGNSKVPSFEPLTDGRMLDPLPGWGINVLRLLFTWEAYQPDAPDQFVQSYLDYYRNVVEAAQAHGLYVVVDFHQDGFSRYALAGCGEGFPKWALPPTVTPHAPDNGPACAGWGPAMFSDADLPTIWDAFYADTYGARAAYLTMIARVAAALKDEPAIIGYDLINEPFGDEVSQLGPFYEQAAAALRAADPNAIVFVSPAGLTSAGNPTMLPKPSFGNFAYAPHFYDATLGLFHGWGSSDEKFSFMQMTSAADRFGAPMFLGEYGAPPSTDLVDGYLSTLWERLNDALASGAQWVYTPGWTAAAKDGWNTEDFSIVDDSGALRANFRPRPYARRVAGTPTALTVTDEKDATHNTLDLTWQNDPAAGATELFLPAAYFGGHLIAYSDEDARCTTAGEVVSCVSTSGGVKHVHARVPKKSCGLTGLEAIGVLALLRWRRRRR